MPNAIDIHRAQLEAAKQVQVKLAEVSELVQRIRSEVDALTRNVEFRNLLRQEETWLQQAQRTVTEVPNTPWK